MNLDRVHELLSSPASAGLAGAVAGGPLTSKSGRKIGKQALQVGGMPAIAGLAYTAWQRHQRGTAAAAEVQPSSQLLRDAGFLPAATTERMSGELDLALFRAMVAAARLGLDDALVASVEQEAAAEAKQASVAAGRSG